MYSPSEELTKSKGLDKIAASALKVSEHFSWVSTPANIILQVIEEEVTKLLRTKMKKLFEDIENTVFKTIGFIGKRCAALREYKPGGDIRTEAELQYAIVDPILDGMVELFDYEVSESIILCS